MINSEQYEYVECPEYEWGVFAIHNPTNYTGEDQFISMSSSSGEYKFIGQKKYIAFSSKEEASKYANRISGSGQFWTYEARKFPK